MRGVLLPVLGLGAVLLVLAAFSSSLGRAPVALRSGNEAVPSAYTSESDAAAWTTASCSASPIFSIDGDSPFGSTFACRPLHLRKDKAHKHPVAAFRKVAKMTIDPTQCARYVAHVEALQHETPKEKLLAPFTIELRPDSTDHDVFLQVFCDGPNGDFGFLEHLPKFVPQGRPVTILDAGANIGGAAILFAQLIAFSGEVLAVDANPMSHDLLKHNVAPWTDTIVPINAAIVSDAIARTGKTIAFSGVRDQYWGFRIDHGNWTDDEKVSHEVETKSLPMLAEMTHAKRFDFVKIDIEGEERYILHDPETARVLCDANCIFMELHDRFEPGCLEAWQHFQEQGCAAEDAFGWVVTTGEYLLYCKKSLIEERREP